MDFAEAIRVSAMHGVLHGGGDYSMRYIMRWYSKTFHTPLSEVEALPVDHLLQHYYEEMYENMEEPERKEEMEKLRLGTEEYLAKKRRQAEEDEEYLRQAEQEEAERQAKKKLSEVKPVEKAPIVQLPKQEISISFADTLDLDRDSV